MKKCESKPRGYWTFERCKEVASKFNTRVEFSKAYKGAYTKALRKDWLDEICSHMVKLRHDNGYWDIKENCHVEAKKYTNRSDFGDFSGSAYNACKKWGWLDEVCSHMEDKYKPKDYWSLERCIEEGLNYTTRGDFRTGSPSCYTLVCKRGWLDKVCSHMDSIQNYSKEECRIVALKYNIKKEFREKEPNFYTAILRHDWLDELCSHMENAFISWSYDMCKDVISQYKTKGELREGNYACYQKVMKMKWYDLVDHLTADASLKDRYIYAYEFPEYNAVYVGLSWNLDIRNYRHMREADSSVFQFMNENNLTESDFEFKVFGYYDFKTASKMEGVKESEYKDNDWIILNKATTGGLGSSRLYWTKKKCIEVALGFNERKKFSLAYKGAYKRCSMEGWLDEVCAHMTGGNKKWTFENCEIEANKCTGRGNFKMNCPNGYTKARLKGWLDIFFPKVNK